MVLWCCHLSIQKIAFCSTQEAQCNIHLQLQSWHKEGDWNCQAGPQFISVKAGRYCCIIWAKKYLVERYTHNLRLFLMCIISRVKWTGKLIEKSSYSAGFVYTEMFPYVSVNAEHNWVCLGMETFFLHNLSINHVCGRVHFTRNSFFSSLAKTPQCKSPPFSLLLALILLSKMFCLAAEK